MFLPGRLPRLCTTHKRFIQNDAYNGWTTGQYWDLFYEHKSKEGNNSFDWFLSSTLLPKLLTFIKPHHSVLHIGSIVL